MKWLICIYSSHDDLHHAKKLRKIINKSEIRNDQQNIIVLTDINQKQDFRYDKANNILYLNIKECYTYLSLKTELMIRACSELFDFEFLVKWDASTIDPERCYTSMDSVEVCMSVLTGKHIPVDWNNRLVGGPVQPHSDYHSHICAACSGKKSASWFRALKPHYLPIIKSEARDLESESFIPKDVTYYRGKFYIISKKFCKYINETPDCKEIFQKNFQHNFGCEDMSVGMCFTKFTASLTVTKN